jgi:hypothetical protein
MMTAVLEQLYKTGVEVEAVFSPAIGDLLDELLVTERAAFDNVAWQVYYALNSKARFEQFLITNFFFVLKLKMRNLLKI